MPSFLRTRAARRWLTWLSVLLAVIGVLGLAGGFEDRTRPAPPEFAVGAEIETTRFTYRVDGAQWAPAGDDGEPRLRVHLGVLNTSKETSIVARWLLFVRLPDGEVLPLESDTSTRVAKDGPGRFLPLIDADATVTFTQGVPEEKPAEVQVLIFDESLKASEGVYTEWWEPGTLVAQVNVPVTEGQW